MTDVISITLPTDTTALVDDDTFISTLGDSNNFAMTLQQIDGGNFFGAPIAPREVSYSNWGLNWAQVNRDGRLPYLIMESKKLPQISFTLVIANSSDSFWDATPTIKILKGLASTRVPIKISYGGYFESNYLWRCTNFSFTSTYRNPGSNTISQAEVDMEFTLLQDVVLTAGPISGGADDTVKPPGNDSKIVKPNVKNAGKRKYKVKKGDTLHKLSYKFYKKSRYWRYLGDINKIKNPKYDAKLTPGKIIKY